MGDLTVLKSVFLLPSNMTGFQRNLNFNRWF